MIINNETKSEAALHMQTTVVYIFYPLLIQSKSLNNIKNKSLINNIY